MLLSGLSLVSLLALASGAEFTYDRCNTTFGPSGSTGWGGSCQTANVGTPVNLCGAVAFSGTAPTLSLSSSWSTARSVNALNNGHTVQLNIIDNAPTLTAGSLANIVGYSTNTSTIRWTLVQIHWHWGRTNVNTEGSEHYQQGTRYPIEGHYVHYNSDRYSDITAAVTSGNTDALLVVGVFFNIGSTDANMMVSVASNATGYTMTPGLQSYQVTMSDLFDGTGDWYGYPGGLTTPNCNLIVTWIVMQTPKTITEATLNKIKAVSTTPPGTAAPLISLYGNFRPLQGKGTRTYYSTSGATAACTTVTEPTFSCSSTSAGVISSPSMMFHLALGVFALFAIW